MGEYVPNVPGLAWRVTLTVIVGIAWLIFLVLWLFFYASGFDIYQNLAIIIVSVLAVGIVVAPTWVFWGIKHGKEMERWERKHKRK